MFLTRLETSDAGDLAVPAEGCEPRVVATAAHHQGGPSWSAELPPSGASTVLASPGPVAGVPTDLDPLPSIDCTPRSAGLLQITQLWVLRHRCGSICGNIHSYGRWPSRPRPGARSGQPLSGWRFPGWLATCSAPGSSRTGLPHVSALGCAVLDEPHPALADRVQPETVRHSPRRHRGSSVHAENPWLNRCRDPHSCRGVS